MLHKLVGSPVYVEQILIFFAFAQKQLPATVRIICYYLAHIIINRKIFYVLYVYVFSERKLVFRE